MVNNINVTEEKIKELDKAKIALGDSINNYNVLSNLRFEQIKDTLKNIVSQYNVFYDYKIKDYYSYDEEMSIFSNFLILCLQITMNDFIEIFPIEHDWYTPDEELYRSNITEFLYWYQNIDVEIFDNYRIEFFKKAGLIKE